MRKSTLSYEVMPPRTPEAEGKFWDCTNKLIETRPEFISITYGAGGNDRSGSLETISKIVHNTPILPVAHITCIDTPKSQVEEVADQFLAQGVRMFLALRGDSPIAKDGAFDELLNMSEEDQIADTAQLTYLIRSLDKKRQRMSNSNKFKSIARPLVISVATFPGGNPALGTTPAQEVDRLLEKQDAGADFAISQLYYSPNVFDDFMNLARKRGVSIPIVAGVAPIWSIERLEKCEKYIGVAPDANFARLLQNAWSPEDCEKIGLDFWYNTSIEAVNSGAPGVHFFTFNNANNSLKLVERLGDF
jgi:methylenetetrahydrofolate reductase (NADPH)